jgi:hypothetical protein
MVKSEMDEAMVEMAIGVVEINKISGNQAGR